jgi:hypothetical protein
MATAGERPLIWERFCHWIEGNFAACNASRQKAIAEEALAPFRLRFDEELLAYTTLRRLSRSARAVAHSQPGVAGTKHRNQFRQDPVHPFFRLARLHVRFAHVVDRMDRMDKMRGFTDLLSVDASQLPIQEKILTHPVNPVQILRILRSISPVRDYRGGREPLRDRSVSSPGGRPEMLTKYAFRPSSGERT